MKEKEPLVTSDDFGRDEASAKVIYISLVNNPRSTLKVLFVLASTERASQKCIPNLLLYCSA